jgi:hyperosmotically inducible periplasmic protein
MRLNPISAAGALALGLLLGGAPGINAAQAQSPASGQAEPTAGQARNDVSDRDIMQKIRKAVMEDKSLSTYAHNVKIIAQNGKVTLRGPVRSEEEKKAVADKATEVAGAGNVTDELTIKASRSK